MATLLCLVCLMTQPSSGIRETSHGNEHGGVALASNTSPQPDPEPQGTSQIKCANAAVSLRLECLVTHPCTGMHENG
eukprot:364015-Pelagomonas_calceolata.AAC.1